MVPPFIHSFCCGFDTDFLGLVSTHLQARNTGFLHGPVYHLSMAGLKDMQLRGRIQPGMIADITIFKPETITDSSTMKIGERGLYTKGIPYVIINGQVSIDNGVANPSILAGQPIRYEPMAECNIPDEIDLGDKKYQWHADLPGYPVTRFPPQKENPPSPFKLERKDGLFNFSCDGFFGRKKQCFSELLRNSARAFCISPRYNIFNYGPGNAFNINSAVLVEIFILS